MKLLVQGEPIQVLFRYPKRELGKNRVQYGCQVVIQRPTRFDGEAPQLLGQSLRYCDSRDIFDRVRGRREGLIIALQNAGFTREQRLDVWEWFRAHCRVLEGDRFIPIRILMLDDPESPDSHGITLGPVSLREAYTAAVERQVGALRGQPREAVPMIREAPLPGHLLQYHETP